MSLLQFTDRGIYCTPADVHIDPWRPVRRALITHGHADHARWGHQYYMSTERAAPVIKHRLGKIHLETVSFDQPININGVRFSFHPAGHVLGSAQIRVEHKGEIWVVSGDYKIMDDGLSEPFEPIQCHTFITECTFGLPVYKWKPQSQIISDINAWWSSNKSRGLVSVITAYALGKAQRILKNIDTTIGSIYTHGAVDNINEVIRNQGVELPETIRVSSEQDKKDFAGALVLAPPSAIGSSWMRRLPTASVGMASGWMTLRGARRRRNADRGFILSDHADWEGLNKAVSATGAEKIIATHGYTDVFVRWLKSQGYNAVEEYTEFEGESADEGEKLPAEEAVDGSKR